MKRGSKAKRMNVEGIMFLIWKDDIVLVKVVSGTLSHLVEGLVGRRVIYPPPIDASIYP
jgi:hypothetical protein